MITEINPNNRLFLINALCFKGDWKYQFRKESTSKTKFTNADRTKVQVDMMKTRCTLGAVTVVGMEFTSFDPSAPNCYIIECEPPVYVCHQGKG